MMTEFDVIMMQVDKTRFNPKPDMWVRLPELKSESQFLDTDVVPYRKPTDPDPNKPSVSTITTQVRKKRVFKKSPKDRIADKSILLAERLGI